MKVLQLLPALEQGGVERVVCELNRTLAAAGVESVVVSRGGRLVARIEAEGGRHVAQDLKSKNPLTSLPRMIRLRRLLRAEKPDVVFVHSRVPAWLFVGANRPLGLKWASYAHGANSVSRYSAVMTRGERIVTPSKFLADYLTAHYDFDRSRLRVIAPCVDFARFDPARLDAKAVDEFRRAWRLDGHPVAMAVGRLSRVKGLMTLVKAMAEPALADARLVLVGGEEPGHEAYADELRGAVAALGLDRRVVFAGSQEKVPECLSLADVVVSANGTKPETFGLSLAEALAMGKPVVAKAFGGALDVVRDGIDGILLPEMTPVALADAIRRAAALPTDSLRAAAESRFGELRFIAETRRLLDELVK